MGRFPKCARCKAILHLVAFLAPILCSSSTVYNFDYTHNIGRRFDGVGAISGGGATSRLLINYPEQQRNQVLDYLFKPNFGASLQILKVEIGGDAQSSEGTEASHMHHEWEENYERGYEWWMMTEAKKRNPHIKLYGLPWGYPGWLGKNHWWPYEKPNKTASYIIKWIQGAKTHYNLTIDYIGIWNEKPYDGTYVKTLKYHLAKNGLSHVQIVAADAIGSNAWDIAKDLQQDQKLKKAVDIIGGHYTGTYTSKEAKMSGKPLWSSEDFSDKANNYGAACIARLLNQNYVTGLMSGFIAWNLVAAYYDALPYSRHSLMVAQQPWSGHYVVSGPVWSTAHTTQFTSIGWQYLPHDTGVGLLKKGGSYVSLISPDRKDFSIILETINGSRQGTCVNVPMAPYKVFPQKVTLRLKGPLKKINELYLWETKLHYGSRASSYFEQKGLIKVKNGSITLDLTVDNVVTLTTMKKGLRGYHGNPPEPASFPLPYKDDFEGYNLHGEANNFAQQVGSFEITQTNDAGHGQVMRQIVTHAPIHWCPFVQTAPTNVIGNYQWADVRVRSDVYVPRVNGSGGAFIAARVDQGGCTTFLAKGVFVFFDVNNQVVELTTDLARSRSIRSVKYTIKNDKWYTLSLSVKGYKVTVAVGSDVVIKEPVKHYSLHGFAAVGTTDFGLVDFDNLFINAA